MMVDYIKKDSNEISSLTELTTEQKKALFAGDATYKLVVTFENPILSFNLDTAEGARDLQRYLQLLVGPAKWIGFSYDFTTGKLEVHTDADADYNLFAVIQEGDIKEVKLK